MPLEITEVLPSRIQPPVGDSSPTSARSDNFFARLLFLSKSLTLTRIARVSAVAFALITGIFLLLSSFTFSWLNIIRNDNVLWVARLVHSYTYLYWIVFLLNGLTLIPAFEKRAARWWTEAFLGILFLIGLALTKVYWLYDVPLTAGNIAWSVAATLPLLCLGIHDIALFGPPSWPKISSTQREIPVSIAFSAGAFIGVWYFGIATARYDLIRQHPAVYLAIFALTVLFHGCIFAVLASLLALISRALARRQISTSLQLIISIAIPWIFVSLILRKLVTPALSFNSVWADVWSWTYPLSFIVMLIGWHFRHAAVAQQPLDLRIEDIASDLAPSGRPWTVALAVAALLSAILVPLSVEQVDWNFLFQRLTAITVWMLVWIVLWRLFAKPATASSSTRKSVLILIVFLACCLGFAQTNRLWRGWGMKTLTQASAAYNGMDASLQVAQLVFRPAIRDDDRTGLFPYLIKNALIADPIHPPQLKLVESLTPTAAAKPDIYIIVIDTLRRDYVSPYNPRVTFTPNIDAFSKESVVFKRAYTNYGGTALSEPAIWAGAMVPSKHYVQPFTEMDALEQLVEVDGYTRVFTLDRILEQILHALPNDRLLNIEGRQHFGLDLRDTLHDLEAGTHPDGPMFVYTQPQNLHPITLRELANSGKKVEGMYPGFNARYADELHKADGAFGEFIQDLKSKGRFDNSIVILTSDHGDWLGEYGRWGHGQSLLPPIIEVPLFIHLPQSLSRGMYSNPSQTVFLTDIAPTLYYLLGHRALRKGEFYGRPLFTETAAEQKDYAQPYRLFMSSYAAVFGLLEEDTQNFYVADAVDQNQSLYNLAEDHFGLDNRIDPATRRKYEPILRGYIDRLNALYGYQPH